MIFLKKILMFGCVGLPLSGMTIMLTGNTQPLSTDSVITSAETIDVVFHTATSQKTTIKISLKESKLYDDFEYKKDNTFQKYSSITNVQEKKNAAWLRDLAFKFIWVQHWINIVRMMQINRDIKQNNTSLPTNPVCTTCPTCSTKTDCSKCDEKDTALQCSSCNTQENNREFAFSMINILSAQKLHYFVPIKAIIKLDSYTLPTTLPNTSETKKITGGLFYGYVDSKNKTVDQSEEFKNLYKKYTGSEYTPSTSDTTPPTKQYFWTSLPTLLTFQTQAKTPSTTTNANTVNTDIDVILKAIKNKEWKTQLKEHDENEIPTTTSNIEGMLKCLIKHNIIAKQTTTPDELCCVKTN